MIGKYVCNDLNAEFEITEATDSNGQGKGIFKFENLSWNVSIHYHFKNSVGPETTLHFWGSKDDPNHYVGAAGCLPNNRNIASIQIAGGVASLTDANAFSGEFARA